MINFQKNQLDERFPKILNEIVQKHAMIDRELNDSKMSSTRTVIKCIKNEINQQKMIRKII